MNASEEIRDNRGENGEAFGFDEQLTVVGGKLKPGKR